MGICGRERAALDKRLGIEVDKTLLTGQDPTGGILGFLRESPRHLIVLATRGRHGVEGWLNGSVSEIVARHSAGPTLFIAPGATGFVSQINGDVRLRRALVPIDSSLRPEKAIKMVALMGRLLTGEEIVCHLLHVGRTAPSVSACIASSARASEIMVRTGNVVIRSSTWLSSSRLISSVCRPQVIATFWMHSTAARRSA
jgi:hypothetical protein